MEGQVARRFGVQLRGAVRGRLVRIHHGRQRFVVDVDQLERIVGLVVRFGDDHGDGVTNVADDIGGDGAIRRDVQPGIRQEPRAGNALEARFGVRPGEHRHHAGRGLGATGIQAANPRVSVRAPQDCRVQHPGEGEIGGVASRAGQEPRVLAPANA